MLYTVPTLSKNILPFWNIKPLSMSYVKLSYNLTFKNSIYKYCKLDYMLGNIPGTVEIPKWEVRALALNKTSFLKNVLLISTKSETKYQVKWVPFWLKQKSLDDSLFPTDNYQDILLNKELKYGIISLLYRCNKRYN